MSVARKRPAPASPEEPGRLVLFKPARPVRAFEEIINQIRALIESGNLSAGDKLPPERELANQLQVSRNTVREALRTLEISGLVTLRRGATGGAFISRRDGELLDSALNQTLHFTDFSVTDFAQAMHAIVIMLLQAALPTLNEDDLRAIENNIVSAETILEPAARSAELVRFYVILAQASHNKILVSIAETFSQMLLSWVLRLGSLSGDRVLVVRREFVRLLRASDTRGAQGVLEDYMRELHRLWLTGSAPAPKRVKSQRGSRPRNDGILAGEQ